MCLTVAIVADLNILFLPIIRSYPFSFCSFYMIDHAYNLVINLFNFSRNINFYFYGHINVLVHLHTLFYIYD